MRRRLIPLSKTSLYVAGSIHELWGTAMLPSVVREGTVGRDIDTFGGMDLRSAHRLGRDV